MAAAVSRQTYSLDRNELNLGAFTLFFSNRREAKVRFEFSNGRTETRPVALDNVPRLSPNGRFGLPVAASGIWTDMATFILDYDEVANINSLVFRIHFAGDGAEVSIKERTGLFDVTVDARRGLRER